MNSKTMASSSDRKRGYPPPVNAEEQMFQRRIADLVSAVRRSGASRFTMFCNDREQELAQAALASLSFDGYTWDGGYDGAQGRMLCLAENGNFSAPLCCLELEIQGPSAGELTHRDYLGAIMGLRISCECIGDILCGPDRAQLVVTTAAARVICDDLHEVGRCGVRVRPADAISFCPQPPAAERTVTLASLRLDALIAAMLHVSRSEASRLVVSGSVQINHVLKTSPGEAVYEEDVFSIRGYGKYKLTKVGARSRKDRIFVTFEEY